MNSILVLSMLSSRAIMAVFSEDAKELLASTEWETPDGESQSEYLEMKYKLLMNEGPWEIVRIFGAQGPGAFTGLRVSSAFLKGLSMGLALPLTGIPSWDFFGEDFSYCLRPAKAAKLNLKECLEAGYKFLQIKRQSALIVDQPTTRVLVGLQDRPQWPNIVELQMGLKASLSRSEFRLDYGYTPEYKSVL